MDLLEIKRMERQMRPHPKDMLNWVLLSGLHNDLHGIGRIIRGFKYFDRMDGLCRNSRLVKKGDERQYRMERDVVRAIDHLKIFNFLASGNIADQCDTIARSYGLQTGFYPEYVSEYLRKFEEVVIEIAKHVRPSRKVKPEGGDGHKIIWTGDANNPAAPQNF